MYKYLKDEQDYIDRYDLSTIKECLDIVKMFREVYQKSLTTEEMKDISEEEKVKSVNYLLYWHLYAIKAQEYKHKNETIAQWVQADRVKQDALDHAPEPKNIRCLGCDALMVSTYKMLQDDSDTSPRVLFFFNCPKGCKPGRAIYDNGEEDIPEPDLCPKCQKEIKNEYKETEKTLTVTKKCLACGFTETDVTDFAKNHAEFEKQQQEEKELLEKHRSEFCLSDKEGQEHIETLEAMEVAHEVREETKRKYDNPIYQRVLQLKRTSILELEKLLSDALGKEKYTKLSLDKPEMGQYVVVPFTVQDSDSSRKDHMSESTLEKLIKNTVKDTNWRLMTSSVRYRLGYLAGTLKGYEREEDLLKLAGKEESPKQTSKIDDEKRQKYAYHSFVQLARLTGEYEGIENMRKRRLEKEPDGFFLEASEGPYACGICGDSHYGNEMWWTAEALRCADCWRNIQEKVIPPLVRDHEHKVWIPSDLIKSEYSVQPATRRKLEREGVLHPRNLQRKDGSTYYTVYLVEENQAFFNKYPKKPEMDIRLEWSKEKNAFLLHAKKIDYKEKETISDGKGGQIRL